MTEDVIKIVKWIIARDVSSDFYFSHPDFNSKYKLFVCWQPRWVPSLEQEVTGR